MDISAILARGSSGTSSASGEDGNVHVGGGGKREGQYKKKGNKLDKRALRQIQDDEQRKAGRSEKQDERRTRNIQDVEAGQENLVEGGKKSASLTRKEKLEEYLKTKKKIDGKKRKEAKPTFRPGGKYKDLNPIAPDGASSMNNTTLNNTKNSSRIISNLSKTNAPSRLNLLKQGKTVVTPAKRTTRSAAKNQKTVPTVCVVPPSSSASSKSSSASSKSSISSTTSTSFAPPRYSFDFRMSAPTCSAPISSTPAKLQLLKTVTASSLPVVAEMEDEVFASNDNTADTSNNDKTDAADIDTEIDNTRNNEIARTLEINPTRNSLPVSAEVKMDTMTKDGNSNNETSAEILNVSEESLVKPLSNSPSISSSQVLSEEFNKSNEEAIQTNMIKEDTVDVIDNKTEEHKIDENYGTRAETISQSDGDHHPSQSSLSSEEENVDSENASTQPRRRSKRRSGVQPDLHLSREELLLTPARRSKRRSASRERRRSGCQMCPQNDLCPATPRSVCSLPSLEESQEETEIEGQNKQQEEEKGSERVTRSARLSQSHGTPATSMADKLDKLELFKTPGKVGDKVPNVVANWVSSERGSSKRKKPGMDRKSFSEQKSKNSISTLFDDLDSSPVLALLERKAKSAEDITEEDFFEHEAIRPNKMVKLDMDQIATEEKQETEIVTENIKNPNLKCKYEDHTTSNKEIDDQSLDDIVRDVPYFRNLITIETERLTKLGDLWEKKLLDNIDSISEDIQGCVRTYVGQARLVMSERFVQLSGLVDDCELGRGERETTTQDLTGFWEMIYFQVEDVDKKFKELEKIENNGWHEIKNLEKVKPVNKVAKSKKTGKKTAAVSSGLRAMIAAKRQAASTSEAEVKDSELIVDRRETASTSGDEEKDAKRLAVREMIARKKAELAKQRAAAAIKNELENVTEEKNVDTEDKSGTTFDGGFFSVSSPARNRSANPSPLRLTKSTGGDRLRRSVVITETARRVSGLMVSPFVSQLGKRSRDNTPVKDVNEDKSPRTYSKCESPSSTPRQKQLEATFDDLFTISPGSPDIKETHWSTTSSETGDEGRVRFTPGLKTDQDKEMTAPSTPHPKSGTKLDGSPRLGRRSRVYLMPMSKIDQEVDSTEEEVKDQELMSFDSPVESPRRKSTRNQN